MADRGTDDGGPDEVVVIILPDDYIRDEEYVHKELRHSEPYEVPVHLFLDGQPEPGEGQTYKAG